VDARAIRSFHEGQLASTTRSPIAILALAFAVWAGSAWAQTYPTKALRIVTSEPGGSNDFVARLIVPGLSSSLGQQVLVDNRPAGVIPGQIVSRSAPDGYSLLLTTSLLWILPMIQSTPFDPVRDFTPVIHTTSTPNILVTHPSVPVKTLQELIALAKARPGDLDYASGALASSSFLAAELFKSMAGVKMMRVPYRGAGPAVLGLLSGQAQLMFATASSVKPHVATGRLRALAITSSRRSPVYPELPAIAESGLSGYQIVTPIALFAPAGTPAAIISRLNSEVVQILNQGEVKNRFLAAGGEVVASSPTELGALMKEDSARMSRLVKSAGIRAE
jgi:tripartite-type tricarboxylate transporter receptor subunit TctC